jgi:protein-S-isoprenylcysteine O-methyltransferase Ste14
VDFRQRLFRYRSYTPFPYFIIVAIFAQPTVFSMVIGFLLVIAGEFFRLWGVAIAGSETRTTGPVGGTFLVTVGPFAFVRNPLYLGNILMYFGVGIIANTPVLAIAGLLFFFIQYALIVSLEEEALLKKFGEQYLRYVEKVPRFIPTMKKYYQTDLPQPEHSWKKGFRSERRTLQAIGILILCILVIWYVRQ